MQKDKNIFETFNDGICNICCIDEEGKIGDIKAALRFRERTVGITRYHEAKTDKLQTVRLIRVPMQAWLTTGYLVTISDEIFEIVQVQSIYDTLPRANDITLRMTRQRRSENGTV